MDNAQTANGFIAGQRLLQSVNGETIVLGSVSYPCLPADLITGNRVWEAGGASDTQNITVSILKEDLKTEPLTNTPATFRGLELRVIAGNDADTFWTIQLVQAKS
jgi:hypothetical protein